MNTIPPMSDNPLPKGDLPEVVHKHRKLTKEQCTMHIDPRLLEEAKKSAALHGYNSVSALIEGHLLLGMIWEAANPGKKHSYTVDVVNDPDLFERELTHLKEAPPKSWGSWMARQLDRAREKESQSDCLGS